MAVAISIPPGVAYGADEAVPDTQGGMSVEDAIYHTVHSYPGGVTALAARMGVSPNTLAHAEKLRLVVITTLVLS